MCIFQSTYWSGADRRSVLSFLLLGKRKVRVLPDNKFLRNLHFARVMKRRASEFLFFAVPSSVNIFNSGTVQVNVSVRTGEFRGQGYGTCGLVSCHHNIFNGLMKVKPKLGFIHKKTYTTDREKNDKKREDMSWYFLFFIHI